MANELIWSSSMILIFRAYSITNTGAVPALSVVDTVSNIAFIIFGGISSAISIMIGKRLGANELDEAVENSKKLTAFAVMVSLGISILLFVGAPFIPKAYSYSSEVNDYIVTLLRIKCFFLPFYVVSVSTFFTLRAGGDMKSTLLLDALFSFCCPAMTATIISFFFAPNIIIFYAGIECFEFLKNYLAIHLWRKKRWVVNLTTMDNA